MEWWATRVGVWDWTVDCCMAAAAAAAWLLYRETMVVALLVVVGIGWGFRPEVLVGLRGLGVVDVGKRLPPRLW